MRQFKTKALTLALASVLVFGTAHAVDPDERLKDAALEERAREISKELRCVVCQSQSIDDSNAPLAKDLRLLVRERVMAGDTNDEVLDYVADRYGDYVLLKPPMNIGTALLWLGPPVFLIGGGLVATIFLRRRKAEAPAPLSEAEAERLNALDRQ